MEQCFMHVEKRHSKISFSSECLSALASRACPAANTRRWSIHTPLDCKQRNSLPPIQEQIQGLARSHTTPTEEVKRSTCILSLEQEEIFPNKEICPAQAVRALYIFARKCSKSKAILMQLCKGQKAAHDYLSQQQISLYYSHLKEKAFSLLLFKCDVSYKNFYS